MKKHAVRYALGLLILLILLCHVTRIVEVPFINSLDGLIYDAKLRLTMPKNIDERIVILDIDEKSLAEVGRSPFVYATPDRPCPEARHPGRSFRSGECSRRTG